LVDHAPPASARSQSLYEPKIYPSVSEIEFFNTIGRILQVSTKAWYAALERAGIADFRWHDLRHTWASWHVQQGTPLYALQELGGWESPEMVRRYAHFAAEHLAPWADRLCTLRVVENQADGTNLSQAGKE
jgi:integrase